MIRICYKDFSAGTHDAAGLQGRVERCSRGITIYLLPGLTPGQRRAVIRRLRQEASRGFGPALPVPQLAIAFGFDRVRTAAGLVRAIVRLHPAVTLVPGALVVAMMALFIIAAGDRSGVSPGPRSGLADTGTVSGGAARAVSGRLGLSRVARVTADEGADGAGAGRTGSGAGSGQCGQLACRRTVPPTVPPTMPRAVPHTAHLPGPLDFAW